MSADAIATSQREDPPDPHKWHRISMAPVIAQLAVFVVWGMLWVSDGMSEITLHPQLRPDAVSGSFDNAYRGIFDPLAIIVGLTLFPAVVIGSWRAAEDSFAPWGRKAVVVALAVFAAGWTFLVAGAVVYGIRRNDDVSVTIRLVGLIGMEICLGAEWIVAWGSRRFSPIIAVPVAFLGGIFAVPVVATIGAWVISQ